MQEFSADMNSRAVKRIEDVNRLRQAQFPEDAGAMAHPIRPDSYVRMDNFYSATVYEKVEPLATVHEKIELQHHGPNKGKNPASIPTLLLFMRRWSLNIMQPKKETKESPWIWILITQVRNICLDPSMTGCLYFCLSSVVSINIRRKTNHTQVLWVCLVPLSKTCGIGPWM